MSQELPKIWKVPPRPPNKAINCAFQISKVLFIMKKHDQNKKIRHFFSTPEGGLSFGLFWIFDPSNSAYHQTSEGSK
jgi:hypothetical protein